MEEESLSGQAVTSVPLLYLLFFRPCFHWHTDEITSSGSPVSNGSLPIFWKANPTCPSLILLPPFPTSSLKFFHVLPHLIFLQSCLPFCPLWTGCDGSDGLLLWESREQSALWLALERCYDSNRKSPLCSSPYSHQSRSSQRVSLTWLHTQQHQSSSNPLGERQLSCNGSYVPLLLPLLLFLLFLIIRSAEFESKRICAEKSFQDHLIFKKRIHLFKLLLRWWASNKFAKVYSWLCWVSLPLFTLLSPILAQSPCLPLGALPCIPCTPLHSCMASADLPAAEMFQKWQPQRSACEGHWTRY